MSEDKHTWDRVPTWDGDKRQWKRHLRDIELHLETEKLDVDFSHGARRLFRLTSSARKYAETIELDQIRRSTDTDRDTREGMNAARESHGHGRCHEEGTSPGFLSTRNSKDVQDNPWPNGLNVELKNMGWHLLEKSNLNKGDKSVCWGQLKANMSSQPFEER